MNHITENELNAYLDDMLEESERWRIEIHLAECLACRARFQELQLVFDNLAALPETELSRDLTPAILSHLPQRKTFFVRSRNLAAQWGVVLGVSLWSAMQFVKAIKLPSPQMLMKFVLLDMPILNLTTFHLPAIHLPKLGPPSVNLPASSLQFTSGKFTLLIASAVLLWVIGNLALLRHKPQSST
jgi:hypothetical protein